MTAKAHKMRRRGLVQLTIFGLIFQAAMSAFMLPMPLIQAAVAAESGGLEMVICTSYGFERVPVPSGGSGQTGHPAGTESCPVCMALAPAASADLPVIAKLPPHDVQPAPGLMPAADLRPESPTVLTHRNRGPPLA
jgi:hypothetical protein